MSLSLVYTDGTFSTAAEVSLPVFSRPIPELDEEVILTSEWQWTGTSRTLTALGTAHPTFSTYYLADESAPTDLGGDEIRWTRTYVKKPSTHSVPGGTIAYSFIGFFGVWGIGITTSTGRERFTAVVKVRVNREYYRIAPSGGDYTAATAIPIISAQRYFYGDGSAYIDTDYLSDSPPYVDASTPSRTAYLAVVAGGSGLGTGAGTGEIVAEASRIYQFRGPIWCRETPYILAL